MTSAARFGLVCLAAVILAAIGFSLRPSDITSSTMPSPHSGAVAQGQSTRATHLPKTSSASTQNGSGSRSGAAFTAPAGPLKDHLDRLRHEAEAGNSAVAFFIASGLFECRVASGDKLSVSDSEGLPDLSTDCRGLTVEDVAEYKRWLQLAADNGDVDAQVSYTVFVFAALTTTEAIRHPEIVADDKRRSMDYLQRAAANGSVAALGSLSSVYGNGIVAPQDYELAYAYQLAYLQASGFPTSALEEKYAQQLSGVQKERARKLAQRLL